MFLAARQCQRREIRLAHQVGLTSLGVVARMSATSTVTRVAPWDSRWSRIAEPLQRDIALLARWWTSRSSLNALTERIVTWATDKIEGTLCHLNEFRTGNRTISHMRCGVQKTERCVGPKLRYFRREIRIKLPQ